MSMAMSEHPFYHIWLAKAIVWSPKGDPANSFGRTGETQRSWGLYKGLLANVRYPKLDMQGIMNIIF